MFRAHLLTHLYRFIPPSLYPLFFRQGNASSIVAGAVGSLYGDVAAIGLRLAAAERADPAHPPTARMMSAYAADRRPPELGTWGGRLRAKSWATKQERKIMRINESFSHSHSRQFIESRISDAFSYILKNAILFVTNTYFHAYLFFHHSAHRACSDMFHLSDKFWALRAKLLYFMDAFVYPAETRYAKEAAANRAAGNQWVPMQVRGGGPNTHSSGDKEFYDGIECARL
jgi:hypothetical protein